MGKHTTDLDKVIFLTHLLYIHQVEAARRAGLAKQTATDIKNATGNILIRYHDEGLPEPSIQDQVEQLKRKEGSGAKPKITDKEVLGLMEAYTLNKGQRKKLWHIVSKEEGFFNIHRRTIEKKLREHGLRRYKSTKKLGLTELQRHQRYEIALSRKDWGLAEWRKVIYSNKVSIIVSAIRSMQNISRIVGESERYYPDYIERQYNNYSEAIFWEYFTYNAKGPCHIYHKETEEQKESNQAEMDRINEDEVEVEYREKFNIQEREKERKWDEKGQKWPKKRASWEVYWKNNIYRGKR